MLLVIVLFTLAHYGYSRAGSGGGSSGGGGGFSSGGYSFGYYGHGYSGRGKPLSYGEKVALVIVHVLGLIAILLAIFGFGILVARQVKQSRKKIQEAEKFDAIWNEEKLIAHTQETFMKVQDAWSQRDLNTIREHVTTHLVSRFQPLLNVYKRKRIVNIMTNINIQKISIVKIHDSENDDEDMFKAYIKGSMCDFLAPETSFTSVIGKGDDAEDFKDIYVFVRSGNSWKLDNIINDPGNSDLK